MKKIKNKKNKLIIVLSFKDSNAFKYKRLLVYKTKKKRRFIRIYVWKEKTQYNRQ